jgi:hypothetical protein
MTLKKAKVKEFSFALSLTLVLSHTMVKNKFDMVCKVNHLYVNIIESTVKICLDYTLLLS